MEITQELLDQAKSVTGAFEILRSDNPRGGPSTTRLVPRKGHR